MTTRIITALRLSRILILPLIGQPLSLGLFIIISTLLLCSIVAIFLSSWYAYILFLIYVGGLLVIFAYVAALRPNVLFRGGSYLYLYVSSSLIFSILLYFRYFRDFRILNYLSDFLSSSYSKAYGIQLVNTSISPVLIALGIILLLNLVVVVKICYYQHASLRPFQSS